MDVPQQPQGLARTTQAYPSQLLWLAPNVGIVKFEHQEHEAGRGVRRRLD